jgi:transposase
MVMTDGKHHDIRVARDDAGLNLALLPDSILSIDKAYIDYNWLSCLNEKGVYFVSRVKDNIDCSITGQHKPIKNKNVVRDDIISLTGFYTQQKYPDRLRIVGYLDPETGKHYEFLTNNFALSAQTIADIYKSRWQIELFFKWIKQNLKIKSFLGTTPNAVLTQIWVAMCYYLLLTYIKYQTKFAHSLTNLSLIIKETLMVRTNLIDILSLNRNTLTKVRDPVPQMSIF